MRGARASGTALPQSDNGRGDARRIITPMSPKTQKGLRWLKFVLMLVGLTAAIKLFFAIGALDPGQKMLEAFAYLVVASVLFGVPAFLLGWLAGPRSPSEGANAQGQVSPRAPVLPAANGKPFDEDGAYAQALREIENAERDMATWARAVAEADGDDGKARARYIRLRVERLKQAR